MDILIRLLGGSRSLALLVLAVNAIVIIGLSLLIFRSDFGAFLSLIVAAMTLFVAVTLVRSRH